jgi:hypothetical protein
VLNKDLLDQYVRLSNNQIGKVIRIRSQVRGRIAEIELMTPQNIGNYVFAAVEASPSPNSQNVTKLPVIVEVLATEGLSDCTSA